MTKRKPIVWIAVACLGWWGMSALAQERSAAPKTPARTESAVATVGGVRITRATLDQRVREAEESYRQRSNVPLPADLRLVVRRQVLEGLIREELLTLEAKRRGMTLTAEQAEEELKKDAFFQNNGLFDEAKFLAVKNAQATQFQQAVAEIQRRLPAIRLKEQIEKQNAPDPAEVRNDLSRRLGTVTLDFLALRNGSFSSDVPEPTERQVIEYYQAHRSEFPRPERLLLTEVGVNTPPLSAEERGSSAAIQAWQSRMRSRADSLIQAVRRGGRLEDLAPSFGELRHDVTAERDRLPADWRETPRIVQALFATHAGSVVGEPILAQDGFVVARVDERQPAGLATLREVVGTVRGRLRAAIQAERDRRDMMTIYASMRDSLRGTGYRIRYAVADTGMLRVPEPSGAELDRYYRGHLADYSFFDSKTSSVGARPFAEVRQDVRTRWVAERKAADARQAAEQLLAVWRTGKRDPKVERGLSYLREVGPLTLGSTVDTGLAGRALTDTLALRSRAATDMIRFARGWVVYQAFEQIPQFVPTLEQAEPLLRARLEPLRQRTLEEGARRFFDEHPERFGSTDVVRFSRLMVNPPDPLTVPLTAEEVEHHYKSNPDDYGAAELVRARHILITPRNASPEADAAARSRAEELLRRIRAGESFPDLAKQYSDDEATRDKGGDVGTFGHGMMLDEFERAAFTMSPGDLRGPVKTEVGYHIIECLEHVPAEMTPLTYARASVGLDAARAKGFRIAKYRADSLLKVLKTPAQARRVGNLMGLSLYQNDHAIGSPAGVKALEDYFKRIEGLRPGRFDSIAQEYAGVGYAITWADSILPPRKPDWVVARDQALAQYRRELDRRQMSRKRAEFDSLLSAGWTFDSLATLFGGVERHGPHGPGSGLERLAGRELLDSLAFGTRTSPPVLQPGKTLGWVEFPAGYVLMRLVDRKAPDAVQLASRTESETRNALERRLRGVYDKLRQRFPVEILDHDLRITELPPVPDS